MLQHNILADIEERYNNNPDSLTHDELLDYFTDLFDEKYEITVFDIKRLFGYIK
jgi:hypothetical protein